jgi:hypothetical protein
VPHILSSDDGALPGIMPDDSLEAAMIQEQDGGTIGNGIDKDCEVPVLTEEENTDPGRDTNSEDEETDPLVDDTVVDRSVPVVFALLTNKVGTNLFGMSFVIWGGLQIFCILTN